MTDIGESNWAKFIVPVGSGNAGYVDAALAGFQYFAKAEVGDGEITFFHGGKFPRRTEDARVAPPCFVVFVKGQMTAVHRGPHRTSACNYCGRACSQGGNLLEFAC